MPGHLAMLQERMNFLRQKPHVFEIIANHSGVQNLTNLESLGPNALSRLRRYVDYYYNIVTFP